MATKRPMQYHLTIKTLGHLHIGSGNTLRQDFDYVVKRGQTWVIDNTVLADAILSEGEDSAAWKGLLKGRPASEFLTDQDFQTGNPIFRYVMPGEPSSRNQGSELQELLKDPWDQAYIPGSSLKGALRTAFIYVGFEKLNINIRVEDLGKAKRAAEKIEQTITSQAAPPGKHPNFDIFKAFQVSDSSSATRDDIAVCNVAVVTSRDPKVPITLECIQPDVTLQALLTFDTALIDGTWEEAKALRWDAENHLKWLRGVRTCANYLSGKRIASEIERWQGYSREMNSYYTRLAELHQQQSATTFLLQLGWGAGWDSKTLGDHLTRDEELFAQIVSKYAREMDKQDAFERGDPYPKSRRLELRANGTPFRPLGWVQITMERIA